MMFFYFIEALQTKYYFEVLSRTENAPRVQSLKYLEVEDIDISAEKKIIDQRNWVFKSDLSNIRKTRIMWHI